jgi:acetyl-CoA carboxylase biotin carboxyl carrier protein
MSRLSFDPEDIRELAAILDETGLSEIEIAEKDRRIRIVRSPAPMGFAIPYQEAQAQAVSPQAAPVAPVISPVNGLEPDASHPGAVPSPMVGVAYLSPDPSASGWKPDRRCC